jgi:hypothetical protein
MAELLHLRNTYDVFRDGTASIQSGTTFVRQMGVKNSPYTSSPADASEMNVHIVANFDAIAHTETLEFPHTGTWFEYYSGRIISVTGATVNETLRPGEYRLYTDVQLRDPVTSVEDHDEDVVSVYPNPTRDELFVDGESKSVTLYSVDGRSVNMIKTAEGIWNIAELPRGLYILKIQGSESIKQVKIIKQ